MRFVWETVVGTSLESLEGEGEGEGQGERVCGEKCIYEAFSLAYIHTNYNHK